MQAVGDDQLIATPGGYIAPGQDIVLAGPNGLLETLPAPGDDSTWFPNLYDDLTWPGPTRHDGSHSYPDPLAAAEVRPALRHLGPAAGRRPTARTRTSRAGPATASAAPSPRSC